ncbi:MAG: Flp pilus assembly protein TadG [Paracoccaceae bacterium]|jgi:Flp pilus assembly protein TadG
MTLWRNVRSTLRRENGNATIDFVIWLPVFIILLGVIADVSLLLNMQARMFDVARDASRLVSLGRMTNVEAQTWAQTALTNGTTLNVEVVVLDGFVTTRVKAPFSEAIVFGRGFLGDREIKADMTMVMEVQPPAAS